MILTGQSHYVTINMENLTANISNADFGSKSISSSTIPYENFVSSNNLTSTGTLLYELQNNLKLKGVEL